MRTFLKVIFKGLLELLSVLLLLAALISVALAIFGNDETAWARIYYAAGGIIGILVSLVLIALANPKDTEGGLIFILLSLINWPR